MTNLSLSKINLVSTVISCLKFHAFSISSLMLDPRLRDRILIIVGQIVLRSERWLSTMAENYSDFYWEKKSLWVINGRRKWRKPQNIGWKKNKLFPKFRKERSLEIDGCPFRISFVSFYYVHFLKFPEGNDLSMEIRKSIILIKLDNSFIL